MFVLKATDLETRIKQCVQNNCEVLKNRALAKVHSKNPLLYQEGTVENLQAQLVDVEAAESVIIANTCVEKCRQPLDLAQMLMQENWSRIAKQSNFCLSECIQLDKTELAKKSMEDQVEAELKLDKCKANCRGITQEIIQKVEAKVVAEIQSL